MTTPPPKVFVSYSHDSDLHKGWVLTLATRLVANGVNVLLDQWDLTLVAICLALWSPGLQPQIGSL